MKQGGRSAVGCTGFLDYEDSESSFEWASLGIENSSVLDCGVGAYLGLPLNC